VRIRRCKFNIDPHPASGTLPYRPLAWKFANGGILPIGPEWMSHRTMKIQ